MQNSSPFADRPAITTERLFLRTPYDGDVDAIVSIVGDWDVARRLARVPHPYTPADARFFLEQVVPSEWVWAITIRGSDALVGVVGLAPEVGADAAELGYWVSPVHWGRGIATEAAAAVISHGFDILGLPCLTSGYFEDNPASGRVLEKLGFVETDRIMQPCLATRTTARSVRMRLPSPNGYSSCPALRSG